MVKIYDTDSVTEIGKKIYEFFEVGASVSITGFVTIEEEMRIEPKGMMVIEYLKLLDEIDNVEQTKTKKIRKYRYLTNSIGGPVAQKIFTYDIRTRDSQPYITIWRSQ